MLKVMATLSDYSKVYSANIHVYFPNKNDHPKNQYTVSINQL